MCPQFASKPVNDKRVYVFAHLTAALCVSGQPRNVSHLLVFVE